MLNVRKVTRLFGQKAAVDNVSFDVDRSMMIGIIGRSGAGKSTFLRMLNRLTDATSGEILFEGRDVLSLRGKDKRAWQSDCAMVFQQFNLVPRMDVVSNVLHGTLNRHSTLRTALNLFPRDDIERAMDILDRLGVGEQAPKRAEALSGGQQQRVAISRALMQDPRVILADEISPDSCRLWDIESNNKLDKDRFRQEMGGMLEAYQEVARRLGIHNVNTEHKGTGPVLVK